METSDIRFLNLCRRLLDIFLADAKYNPSNPLLETANLDTRLTAAYPIAEDVPAKLAPLKIKINNRQAVYEPIYDMVRRSRRYLKSSGASDREIEDAQTVISKILGTRKSERVLDDPATPADEAAAQNSVSHASYDAIQGNVNVLRDLYANISAYAPNEDGVKLIDFDAVIDACRTANNEVSAGFPPVMQSLSLRDAKLYDDTDSILELFRDAKEYYKSLYDSQDPEYRAVTAITLDDNSRR
jgi:hypothetical protein